MDFLTPNESRFFGKSDSETLQNVIDFAAESGEGQILIPRHNARTGENIWIIDKTVLLPSDCTVLLDNCHLRLADGVRENIFRNKNCGTPEGRTREGEQHGIRLIGIGNALLDGGEPNGLSEQLRRDHPEKYPHMSVNLLVWFSNVRDFEIRGLHVIESRWWAFCFVYCRWGRISNIDFKMHATLENQDGIDLRVGCEYITIENITGITGDDTVALTALNGFERDLAVEGKSKDIHDITIKNIISSTHGCSIIRFLCEDGIREYNITVDGVKDTGESIASAPIFLGSNTSSAHKFWRICPRKMGDFENVVIRNVSTCAQKGIMIAEPCRNVHLENFTFWGQTEVGFYFLDNFACENFTVRNVTYHAGTDNADCVFCISEEAAANMKDFSFSRIRAGKTKYIFRRGVIPVSDFLYEEPSVAYFTPEKPTLASAYGRYFRCAWGKVIENRPTDNRFTPELLKKRRPKNPNNKK